MGEGGAFWSRRSGADCVGRGRWRGVGGRTPWTNDHWRFFLRNLKRDVLNDGGTLFMTLANGKLTEESWAYLESIADWTVEKSKQIQISKFDDLG